MSSAEEQAHNPYVAHHFETMEQQEEAATLGMWLFLATEVMFFGGMFLAYAVYRAIYLEAWYEGSHSLDVTIGAINTTVLLLSSFSMALGVYFAQTSKTKALVWSLVGTIVLGLLFLGIKWFLEWQPKLSHGVIPTMAWNPHGSHYAELAASPHQGGLRLFFWLYFVMTGMHAVHMIIGIVLLLILVVMAARHRFHAQRYMPIMNFGLYWHFVDIVWVFLFPLFYLVA